MSRPAVEKRAPVAAAAGRRYGRIAVVVPAHDEEKVILRCLSSIERAARRCVGAVVEIFVACDACGDRTEEIVRAAGHRAVRCNARNVGVARALGATAALARGAAWLAFTDADTLVDEEWLAAQLALDADVVCGTVGVDDWMSHDDPLRAHFAATYSDHDGHRHIHGANLGMSAAAYRAVGGFGPLANHEDVAIVRALEAAGARIAWSAAPRVFTSARPDFRATSGFGATLAAIRATIVGPVSAVTTPALGG